MKSNVVTIYVGVEKPPEIPLEYIILGASLVSGTLLAVYLARGR